jgi:YVTN family beta-propeller protein
MSRLGGSRRRRLAVLLLGSLLVVACASPHLEPLTATGEIALRSDNKLTVDLLSLDERSGRLYIPRRSQSVLDVIDTKTQKIVTSLSGLSGVSAIAVTSDPDVVFTSNSGDGTVGVVDVSKGTVLSHIEVGGHPEAIAYDPVHDLVIVSLGSARKLAFIDRANRTVAGTLELPGDPGLMAIDMRVGRVFLAIHDKDEVAAVDPAKREIPFFYQGCDITSPTGVAYDADQGRLFVASSGQLNIIDTLIDRCIGAIDIGRGTRQIAMNPRNHHLYTANGGSGDLSIIDAVGPKLLNVMGTRPGADTLAVEAGTNKVFVAEATARRIAVFHDP